MDFSEAAKPHVYQGINHVPAFLRITPPSWMRHVVPWWVLDWLDRRLPLCWASVACWKMGYGAFDSGWWVTGECLSGPKGWEDYCSKFDSIPSEQEVARHD